MKILSTHTDPVVVEDWDNDIVGNVLFIDGKLARVLSAKLTNTGRTAVMKALYYIHTVTCYELIAN